LHARERGLPVAPITLDPAPVADALADWRRVPR